MAAAAAAAEAAVAVAVAVAAAGVVRSVLSKIRIGIFLLFLSPCIDTVAVASSGSGSSGSGCGATSDGRALVSERTGLENLLLLQRSRASAASCTDPSRRNPDACCFCVGGGFGVVGAAEAEEALPSSFLSPAVAPAAFPQ